jgi:hypothetical protein
VARQNGVHDLRNHGVFITQDTGKKRFSTIQFADEITTKFFFQRPVRLKLIEKSAGA